MPHPGNCAPRAAALPGRLLFWSAPQCVRRSVHLLSLPLRTLRGTAIINRRHRAKVLLSYVRHGPRSAPDSERRRTRRGFVLSAGSVRSSRRPCGEARSACMKAKNSTRVCHHPTRNYKQASNRMCGDAETLALACQSYMHASLVWKAGHLPGPGSAGWCVPPGRNEPRAALESATLKCAVLIILVCHRGWRVRMAGGRLMRGAESAQPRPSERRRSAVLQSHNPARIITHYPTPARRDQRPVPGKQACLCSGPK